MAADIELITKEVNQLQTARLPHELVWRECFDLSLPVRGDGFSGAVIRDATTLLTKRARLMDGTAGDALETQAAGIQGGTTPSSTRWFGLEIEGASDESKQWLDNAAISLHKFIHSSNYEATRYETLLDIGGAGWSVLYIDLDRDAGGFRFEQWPIAECFIAASWPGGPVNKIARKWRITADQAVMEYGDDVSSKTRELARSKPHTMVEMTRFIFKRRNAERTAFSNGMPFASVTFESAHKHIVRELGYEEFPCVVPRWRLIPGSSYAVGPMYTAVPDMRELNELRLGEKQSLQMAILPPFKSVDDGVLNSRSLGRLKSGKLYAVADIRNLEPISTGAQPLLADNKAKELKAAIRRALMADVLEFERSGPQMTAEEVRARINQIRQILGPQFGRINSEELSPTVIRCFSLAVRLNAFGPPPDEIAGRLFQVKYTSPFARAQQFDDVLAMGQYEADLLNQAGTGLLPEALDVYNWDEARRRKAELQGVPLELIRTQEELTQIREQRRQAEEQARQQAQQDDAQQATAEAGAKRFAEAA